MRLVIRSSVLGAIRWRLGARNKICTSHFPAVEGGEERDAGRKKNVKTAPATSANRVFFRHGCLEGEKKVLSSIYELDVRPIEGKRESFGPPSISSTRTRGSFWRLWLLSSRSKIRISRERDMIKVEARKVEARRLFSPYSYHIYKYPCELVFMQFA